VTLRRNVLIFHGGALGDFVLTWPFAVAMGRIYPQSRIIYVTAGEKGRLAERALRLESTDAEAGWHGLYAPGGTLPERSAKLLAGAHAVYAFAERDPVWAENVARLSPGANVVTIPTPDPSRPGHWTDGLLHELSPQRPECEATRQLLRSVAERGIGLARPGGGGTIIHPGSGSPDKCWPAEHFAELAERLTAAGRRVAFVVGEAERDRWPAERLARLSAAAEVRQPATLLDLLAELTAADAFIGNDSGPGHLAGILGVPTLSLFGPTDPDRWHPLGPAVRTVRRQPLHELSVDTVAALIGAKS
jgi:heptosyltransferase-3